MLRFFRTIRQRLLTENRVSKYLLYAIGEILLVVIGILIALQINTWNTTRENDKKEREYLSMLTDELRSELLNLKQLEERFKATEVGLKRLSRQWQSGNSTIRDSVQYLKDYTYLGFENPWYTEPVTWTLLQQTGDLSLIRENDLIKELFVYYSTLKKMADNYLQFPMEMVKQARRDMDMPFVNDQESMDYMHPLIMGDSINFNPQGISRQSEIFKQIWENRTKLLPLAVVLSNVSQAQQYLLSPLIDSGEKLLIHLESYQSRTHE